MSAVTGDPRAKAVESFKKITGLNVTGLRQRGRDKQTATFELVIDGGTRIPLGTIKQFWNYDEFCQSVLVATGEMAQVPDPENPMKPKVIKAIDWKHHVRALIAFVAAVEEIEDEAFEAALMEWLQMYSRRATTDQEGALSSREPFRDEKWLYVHAATLAGWLRRSHGEQVTRNEVIRGLRGVGATASKINVGTRSARSSVSYYRIALASLSGDDV